MIPRQLTRRSTDSPWLRIAQDDAHEWFRDNPGTPWPEFYRWAAEQWEPEQFLRAGHGWQPGDPVDRVELTAAHLGLAEAVEVEVRRRAARRMLLGAAQRPPARLRGRGAGAGHWWARLGHRKGAA